MRRRTSLAMAFVVAAGVSGGVLGSTLPSGGAPDSSTPSASGPAGGAGSSSPRDAGRIPVVTSAADRPIRVAVPSLGIDSALDRIRLLPDRTLPRPPRWDVAAWYAGGPRPGEIGPAVIAGHVDSPTGPAVFARLAELTPGDELEVTDASGATRTFTVDRSATAPKSGFPTQAVYGPTPDAQLRLITCDGPYLSGAGGYQDNLIVWATLVG